MQGRIGNQDYTVAVLNAQTYSYDCLNGLFRTVLIRSAPFARHRPWPVTYNDTNAWQDQGRQERRFWLMGGVGDYTKFNLDRRAEEFQTSAEYVMDSAHPGQKGWQQSFLEILPGNVWVLAMKRAETLRDESVRNGTILRIQERAGIATQRNPEKRSVGPGSYRCTQALGVKDASGEKFSGWTCGAKGSFPSGSLIGTISSFATGGRLWKGERRNADESAYLSVSFVHERRLSIHRLRTACLRTFWIRSGSNATFRSAGSTTARRA